MSGIKPMTEMTEVEQLASYKAYLISEDGLVDAIDLLRIRKANFDTKEGELKKIRIKLADAEADLAKVRARLIAFKAGALAMKPPNDEIIKEISEQAGKLDRMVANAETADTIVAATKLLLEAWGKTQTG
jgi:precorrin-6B methylase 2